MVSRSGMRLCSKISQLQEIENEGQSISMAQATTQAVNVLAVIVVP